MFGRNRNKRVKKELKKEKKALKSERSMWEAQQPKREAEQEAARKNQFTQNLGERERAHEEARKRGRAYAEEFTGRNVQGLTPEQKSAMQFEANRQIEGDLYKAGQQLSGQRARSGIGKRSGAAFAQQQELRKLGQEAKGQSWRDIERANADQRLKNLAAQFAIEQGETGRSQLERQLAQDELELAEEKRRNRSQEDRFNRLFSRV